MNVSTRYNYACLYDDANLRRKFLLVIIRLPVLYIFFFVLLLIACILLNLTRLLYVVIIDISHFLVRSLIGRLLALPFQTVIIAVLYVREMLSQSVARPTAVSPLSSASSFLHITLFLHTNTTQWTSPLLRAFLAMLQE